MRKFCAASVAISGRILAGCRHATARPALRAGAVNARSPEGRRGAPRLGGAEPSAMLGGVKADGALLSEKDVRI
jgi:hypothetical protein